jgi:tRNA G26 N,N-dimethylase Trm1
MLNNLSNHLQTKPKYCPKCKHIGHSNYCPECGTALQEMETRQTTCPCCGGRGYIEEPVYNGVIFSSDPQGIPRVMLNNQK